MSQPHRSLLWLSALILAFAGLGPAAAPEAALTARLQPALAQLAAQAPNQTVAVIVQTTAAGGPEMLVAQLGGKVTKDLHIIHAFTAELRAQAVTQLARADGVKWVSLDSPVVKSGGPDGSINTRNLLNSYIATIGADRVWAEGYQGSAITVAVVDSGMNIPDDVSARMVGGVECNKAIHDGGDQFGHGDHVAGIIAGNGTLSKGNYIGVAPKANLVNVKVSDNQGSATASDVVCGLQWVSDHAAQLNIRVVNLSLNSAVNESYQTDPLDAAVEALWFNKIVVVVSSGNVGKNALYPPANDPFVITVGAVDDNGTASRGDDAAAVFSGGGSTIDGFAKPDLVAPGVNIVSLLSSKTVVAQAHPDHLVGKWYFRMSGTSMATPMVSGAAALLLQAQPELNPDQVKQCLTATASWTGVGAKVGWGELDAYGAVHCNLTNVGAQGATNNGLTVSHLLFPTSQSTSWGSVNWNSVNWNSVNWNSVNWNSVNWNSVNWNSVNWNSDYWGS